MIKKVKAAVKGAAKIVKKEVEKKAQKRVGTSMGIGSELQMIAMHNAAALMEAIADPSGSDPQRIPDGFAATVVEKYRFRLNTSPVTDSGGGSEKVQAWLIKPCLKGCYSYLTASAAFVPTWSAAQDHPNLSVYEANFNWMRVSAYSIIIHDTGAWLDRGVLIMVALLPTTSSPTGSNLFSQLSAFPQTKVFSSTESKVSARPQQFPWLPLTFQSTAMGTSVSTVYPTAYMWKDPSNDNNVTDQQLCVAYYGPSTISDTFQIEVIHHFEAVPYISTWNQYRPQKAIGTESCVSLVADAAIMADDRNLSGDITDFQRGVKKVCSQIGGGFFSNLWGGIKKGVQFVSEVGQVASGVMSLLGQGRPKLPADPQQLQQLHAIHVALVRMKLSRYSPYRDERITFACQSMEVDEVLAFVRALEGAAEQQEDSEHKIAGPRVEIVEDKHADSDSDGPPDEGDLQQALTLLAKASNESLKSAAAMLSPRVLIAAERPDTQIRLRPCQQAN